MTKVLILGDANSSHLIKWASGISGQGFEVKVFSLTYPDSATLKEKGIEVVTPLIAGKHKLLYPFAILKLQTLIKNFNPDILHAHYASSYGLLGAMTQFHPFIVSVWGSDVYDFPKISPITKLLLQYVMRKTDSLCSTSQTMKAEIRKYTAKEITVIPFGVDLKVFKPFNAAPLFENKPLVIGTVKTLEKKYGIKFLIQSFSLLKKRRKNDSIKLLIVGKGGLEKELKKLVFDLGIENSVLFMGYIPNDKIAYYHNQMSIEVFPSIDESESFGVSVIEASACEKPVVVSRVGGLPEVVEEGMTGFIVPPCEPEKIADAIEKLLLDEALRTRMGKQGRERVARLYDWNECIKKMVEVYKKYTSSDAFPL